MYRTPGQKGIRMASKKKRERPKLAPGERDVLRFIKKYIKEHRFPPAHQDISDGTGLSMSAVHTTLQLLEAKCYIERIPHKSRAITILS